MSIFPQTDIDINSVINQIQNSNTLPLPKEYAWDYENNDFLLENGKYKIVTGLEAIKVWIWFAINTPRYRFLAYPWSYGNELENLIGTTATASLTQAEAQRYLEECLLVNTYITSITNLVTSQVEDKLKVTYTVNTVYGSINMSTGGV